MNSTPARQLALLTGANHGIGKEAATQLAELGMHVIVGSRHLAEGRAIAPEIEARGLSASAVGLDVTDPESVREAGKTVEAKHGLLDVLTASLSRRERDRCAYMTTEGRALCAGEKE